MRVELNRERCTGHARCFAIAPEVYDIDDDGFCLRPASAPIKRELEEAARAGIDACPENALTAVDDQ